MTFKDHFTAEARKYASARPTYPAELFAWIAAHAPSRGFAWDCATGSGQAARDLARYFGRVVATDASPAQISQAPPAPGVEYRVATAEQSGLDDHSAHAITVASALHWFEFDAFFREARRVLVPGGLVVAWCYSGIRVDGEVDAAIAEFAELVATYWPPERRYVDEGYTTIPFPLREVVPPRPELRLDYTRDQLVGYLASWSASARYRDATGRDPLPRLHELLDPVWGEPDERRRVRWQLYVRAGYTD
jgi:SAM-dependent methyltransferase